ncbi:MAG: DUF167 domain-containing protein [Thermoplasmata archaeon]
MNQLAHISVCVRAGSTADTVAWDEWRKRWVVSCRAPAVGGQANRAVAALVADWLGLPHSSVHWIRAGTSRAKLLGADGIHDAEAANRLRAHAIER